MDANVVSDQVIVVLASLFTLLVIVTIAIAVPVTANVRNRREREQTKREIAAYVAEGTIPPDKGVELMQAAADGDHEVAKRAMHKWF